MSVLAIILFTIREGIARKTIIAFFSISTLFLLFTLITALLSDFDLDLQLGGEGAPPLDKEELIRQGQIFITGFLNFGVLVLSIFATASFIPNTLEKGSIDVLLSKPVSRDQILLGRFLGSTIIVLVNVLWCVAGMWLILSVKTGYWNQGFLAVVLPITYSFIVIYTVMMVLGVMTRSSALTIIIVYMYLFIFSPLLRSHETIAQLSGSDGLGTVLRWLYYIFPKSEDLTSFAQQLVMHGPLDWMPVWSSAIFGAVMYGLAVYLLRRKDL